MKKGYCFFDFIKILTLVLVSNFTLSAQDIDPKDWHNLKGFWKFEDAKNLTKATVGNDLKLVGTHAAISGPATGNAAVRIPMGSYYVCDHGIAPNGGGKGVNQFTMVFDFKIIGIDKWHCFYQTDTTNKNDGECFIRPKGGNDPVRIGVAATDYAPDSVHTNRWYRLAVSVNNGGFYRYYLNGKLILEGDTQDIDDRFTLLSKVLFFADNFEEDDTIDIAALALFDTCLSTNDIVKMGYIDPCQDNPTFLSLGNDTTSCENNTINFTATSGFSKYEWSTGDNSNTVKIDTSLTSIGLGNNNIWVKATDARGCEYKDSLTLIILKAPPIIFNTKNEICDGKSMLINAGDINFFYEWTELGSSKIYSTNSTAKFDSAGKFHVKITGTNSCITEENLEFIINQNPPKPIIIASGNTTICAGDSLQLIAPKNYQKYNWSNGMSSSEIYVQKNSEITLTVFDLKGCESPVSDTTEVKIQLLPTKPQIKINGKAFFCDGDSIELEAPSNFAKYIWSDGKLTQNNYVKIANDITLQVIDSIGCKSPISNSVKTTVYTLPAAPTIQLTGDTAFCEGGSATLSVPSGKQYIWEDGQVTTQKVITKSGSYSVIERDVNSCKSLPSKSVNIIVFEKPAKPIITPNGNVNVCAGETITLLAPTGATNYFWSDSSHNNPIMIKDNGNYFVKIQDANGCLSDNSDVVKVSKIALPKKPSISAIGTTKLQCFDNAQRYRWYKNGVLISDTIKTIPVNSHGYYQVQIADNGCWSALSDSFNYDFSSVKNIQNFGINIYPNPTNSSININIENMNSDMLVEIYDLQGKLVLKTQLILEENKSGKNIDLESLSSGIYLIKISNDEMVISKKIEKQ